MEFSIPTEFFNMAHKGHTANTKRNAANKDKNSANKIWMLQINQRLMDEEDYNTLNLQQIYFL